MQQIQQKSAGEAIFSKLSLFGIKPEFGKYKLNNFLSSYLHKLKIAQQFKKLVEKRVFIVHN
jgi:hypothetical protein